MLNFIREFSHKSLIILNFIIMGGGGGGGGETFSQNLCGRQAECHGFSRGNLYSSGWSFEDFKVFSVS